MRHLNFIGAALAIVLAVPAAARVLEVKTPVGIVRVEPWTERIIHVQAGASPSWKGNYNPAVVGAPQQVKATVSETPTHHVLATAALKVLIGKTDGAVSFQDAKGAEILAEAPGSRQLGRAAAGVVQAFTYGGPVLGLGQHLNGLLDYNGSRVHLQQANRDVAVPMLVSPAGFGVLWNNASVTDVDIGIPSAAHPLIIHSEAGGGVDYHFIYGPELDDVVGGYRELTGRAPMMARWTWGLWQSKERYQTQDELLGIAARYRAMHAPLDAVVQDWQYWSNGQWGEHRMEPERFPDPKAMIGKLHGQNVHAIISVWARFDTGTSNTKELDKAGALYPKTYRNVYPAGEGRWYDAYSPSARRLYWDQINRNLGKFDWDGWWLDASEAELGGSWGEMRDVRTAAGSGKDVLNAYPLMHTTGVFEGMRKDFPAKRPFILTRSAFSGQQRNAAITWSGDTHATWDVLRAHVPAALNFTLSGIPYWSADIGGFFGGDPADPAYAELFTRWYQFGAFNPMFRVHGTGPGKEIWTFGQSTQKILLDYARLRYRLLPYIYSASWDVTSNHGTMMRALAMDFRSDRQAVSTPDQYMFGKALMVAPVLSANTNVRTVYLPAQTEWFDFWTGSRHAGGQVIAAKADIATIPLFARAGSILPLGPVIQYADEKSDEAIELRIYPGKDGSTLLYDDAGDGDAYTRREYATRLLEWNQSAGQLSIRARQGQFPGMRQEQAFLVRCGAQPAGDGMRVIGGATDIKVDLPGCR